ncbi:hypothetical protein [Rhodocyclus tenuis]|uniref:hypothetical protein n=1 Tax=Rhodocyclus tenuis TaxID=1066 RepID=UPI001904ABBF|nr:hypothetical protein [Rhodocyclus tenuis]
MAHAHAIERNEGQQRLSGEAFLSFPCTGERIPGRFWWREKTGPSRARGRWLQLQTSLQEKYRVVLAIFQRNSGLSIFLLTFQRRLSDEITGAPSLLLHRRA